LSGFAPPFPPAHPLPRFLQLHCATLLRRGASRRIRRDASRRIRRDHSAHVHFRNFANGGHSQYKHLLRLVYSKTCVAWGCRPVRRARSTQSTVSMHRVVQARYALDEKNRHAGILGKKTCIQAEQTVYTSSGSYMYCTCGATVWHRRGTHRWYSVQGYKVQKEGQLYVPRDGSFCLSQKYPPPHKRRK